MSRYDIRIRKQTFRSRSIDQHKDFRSLERRYTKRRRAKGLARLLAILIGLLLLLGALLFSTAQSKPLSRPQPARVVPAELEFKSVPERL